MKAHFLVIGILAAATLATDSFAGKTAITELSGDFTGRLGKLPRTGKVQVHRITSPAAFKRVIGDRDSPVDFGKRDGVVA